MLGDKYREIGYRRIIHIHWDDHSGLWRIYRGHGPFPGHLGETAIAELAWRREDEAQAFLDTLAKKRQWRRV